jgi:hypothetical protein
MDGLTRRSMPGFLLLMRPNSPISPRPERGKWFFEN